MLRDHAIMHARKLLKECGDSPDAWVRYDTMCSLLDMVKEYDITPKELKLKRLGSFLAHVKATRGKIERILGVF